MGNENYSGMQNRKNVVSKTTGVGSNPATPANQIANLNDRIMAIVWLNYNIIRVFSSILDLHKKRKHTAKVGSSFIFVEWGLKIVSKGHIYAFLLKRKSS